MRPNGNTTLVTSATHMSFWMIGRLSIGSPAPRFYRRAIKRSIRGKKRRFGASRAPLGSSPRMASRPVSREKTLARDARHASRIQWRFIGPSPCSPAPPRASDGRWRRCLPSTATNWRWWHAGRRNLTRLPTRLPQGTASGRWCSRSILPAATRGRGGERGFVINNGGFGLAGAATALDRAEQLAMIDLNVRSLTDMSLRWVESLVRHRGGILNVASVAGFLSGPNMAVYYATKSYVLSFSEALHVELKPRGVRVTVLAPGPVPTEFQARAGISDRLPRLLSCSPEKVARAGYKGLMRGQRVVVPGLGRKLATFMPRLLPRGLMLRLVLASQKGRAGARPQNWPRRRPEGSG